MVVPGAAGSSTFLGVPLVGSAATCGYDWGWRGIVSVVAASLVSHYPTRPFPVHVHFIAGHKNGVDDLAGLAGGTV